MSATGPRYGRRRVWTYREGAFREADSPVVEELPVTIYLNGREIITFLASDDALEYLAAGFLKSEGLVTKREDIAAIRIDSSRTRVEVEASR